MTRNEWFDMLWYRVYGTQNMPALGHWYEWAALQVGFPEWASSCSQ